MDVREENGPEAGREGPGELIGLSDYCERFGVTMPTARRQVREVPGLAWKVAGRVRIDARAAAELHRPKPAWKIGTGRGG